MIKIPLNIVPSLSEQNKKPIYIIEYEHHTGKEKHCFTRCLIMIYLVVVKLR